VRFRTQRGIAAHIAYYLSIKNEPTVTSARYSQNTEQRLARSNIPTSGKIYLNQRLADNWPATHVGLATILQVEQTTSFIDLYETVIRIAQRLVAFGTTTEVTEALLSSLKKLVDVNDHRIDKLLILLDGNPFHGSQSLIQPSYFATDALLAGDLNACWRLGFERLRKHPININDLITASFCVEQTRSSDRATAVSTIIERLSTIYRKNDDFDRVANETLRIGQNLHFLPTMRSLRQICELECFPKSVVTPALKLRFLNGRELDVRDLTNGFDVAEPKLAERLSAANPSATTQFVRALATKTFPVELTLARQLSDAVRNFIDLDGQHREAAAANLLQIARRTETPRQLSIHISLQLVSYLITRGQLDLAAEISAHEFVIESTVARVLPISDMIGADGWRTLRPYAQHISVPIVLDLWWRQTSDDRVATYRRFATQQFLAKNGVQQPSQLRPTADKFPRSELIYFLDQICVYSVLDMLPVFTSSSELQDERKLICEILAEIDPSEIERYQHEVLEIGNRLVVQSGLDIVDGSRIHVDMDGIARWAKRELEESFFRYKALISAGVGVAENFDDVLKKLLRGEDPDRYLRLPSNEADEILISVVSQLLERFLLDSSYGLDSYLSQRIRHGSLMNYLRREPDSQI
jgi:hypothetical protein